MTTPIDPNDREMQAAIDYAWLQKQDDPQFREDVKKTRGLTEVPVIAPARSADPKLEIRHKSSWAIFNPLNGSLSRSLARLFGIGLIPSLGDLNSLRDTLEHLSTLTGDSPPEKKELSDIKALYSDLVEGEKMYQEIKGRQNEFHKG